MAQTYRKWSGVDDAELLTLIARADDSAFTEFVNRYAIYVVALASRVLGTLPPADLPVAVLARIRTLAGEGPRESASVKEWVLDLALAFSLAYRSGTYHDSTSMHEDERRDLARQIADNSDLFQQIEEFLAHHVTNDVPQHGRVGIARGHYRMMPTFDDPLPEFEAYE